MKKLLAFALVLTMCLSLFPVFAAADEGTPTITAYTASDLVNPVGTYSTIDAAATAAGPNGKIVLSAGTFYFNGRQTIAVDGITLEGAGMSQTTVTTSSSYAGGSTTNRKALLTIAASNVTVSGISFDGGVYGRTLVPTSSEETQFNLVRVNSGTATFNNVGLAGSKRTLLSVGTSSTYAEVTANGLYCDGMDKVVTNGVTYADVSIVNGKLTLDANCVIDAFICLDQNSNPRTLDCASCPELHTFTVRIPVFFFYYDVSVTSTLKHFAHSYTVCTSSSDRDKYATVFNYNNNVVPLNAMVTEAIGNLTDGSVTDEDLQIANDLMGAVSYAKLKYPSNAQIATWYTNLENAINAAQA